MGQPVNQHQCKVKGAKCLRVCLNTLSMMVVTRRDLEDTHSPLGVIFFKSKPALFERSDELSQKIYFVPGTKLV